MRQVIYSMMVTLDGYIAAPNEGLEWGNVDEELHRFANDQERQMGGHLYGRRMYEVMTFWSTPAPDSPSAPDYIREYAQIWRAIPKVVFSRTLDKVEGNARLVRDDVAGEVMKLKAQPGGDLVVGGAGLAASFAQLGLIDEYQLFIHPVILGRGKRMFAEVDRVSNLRLVDTHRFSSGVMFLRYALAPDG
ncbi:MAG TPA: dihydrofolate reductase family protein [Aggregatilineaceae bacterium]|jgi:dihydrofolate reductase|nr:dihydrofolate reductase family protein [Anaerolineae bacterium]HMM29098.1 dihydrofolate reductase family protein [Aggregatilineaceae bacterium]